MIGFGTVDQSSSASDLKQITVSPSIGLSLSHIDLLGSGDHLNIAPKHISIKVQP